MAKAGGQPLENNSETEKEGGGNSGSNCACTEFAWTMGDSGRLKRAGREAFSMSCMTQHFAGVAGAAGVSS